MTTASAPLRAALYCRISRDDHGSDVKGVANQERRLRALAVTLGAIVACVIVDNDVSASKYGRKPRTGYAELLAAIDRGDVDVVLAVSPDRLYRSAAQHEEYGNAVTAGRYVRTIVADGGEIDFSTADGEMVGGIGAVVARRESRKTSERIRAEKARAYSAGEWSGGVTPFGFRRVERTRPDGTTVMGKDNKPRYTIAVDHTVSGLIADAVRDVVNGVTVYAIVQRWNAASVPTPAGSRKRAERWTATTVRRVLARPALAGLVVYGGETARAEWDAIITEEQHRAVVARLSTPGKWSTAAGRTGRRSLRHVGSGLYACTCGAPMRSATDGVGDTVYRCTERGAGHAVVKAVAADEYVLATVSALLDREGAALLPPRADDSADLIREVNEVRAMLEKLDDDLARRKITYARWSRMQSVMQSDLDALTARMEASAGHPLDGVADAACPSEAFAAVSVDRQRAIIREIMTVTVLPGKRGRGALPAVERVIIDPIEAATVAA